MQTVLEQGSMDKPLTFDVGLIQLGMGYQWWSPGLGTWYRVGQMGWSGGMHLGGGGWYRVGMSVVQWVALETSSI